MNKNTIDMKFVSIWSLLCLFPISIIFSQKRPKQKYERRAGLYLHAQTHRTFFNQNHSQTKDRAA
jgi:hypothetical protein